MDDIIYTLSCMRATGSRIRIRTIDIPTLSGPTSGVTMMDEFKEFVVQGERWTIGACEVFHYFFVKLIKCNYLLPGLQYVSVRCIKFWTEQTIKNTDHLLLSLYSSGGSCTTTGSFSASLESCLFAISSWSVLVPLFHSTLLLNASPCLIGSTCRKTSTMIGS